MRTSTSSVFSLALLRWRHCSPDYVITLRASQAAELPGQVEALLRAVNATNDFEAEMAARFGGGTGAASEEVRYSTVQVCCGY